MSSVLIVEGSSVHVEPCSELQYYEYHDCELLMLSDPVSDGPDSVLAENPPENQSFVQDLDWFLDSIQHHM